MNDKTPLISVVTVTYNCVSTLEETILSVVNQTYSNIESIIIDGGSTDGTTDIIKKYHDKIAYWTSEKDNGIYDAMNKAIDVASGDFIIFLGSDDHFISYGIIKEIVENNDLKGSYIYYGNVYCPSRNDIYVGKFNRYKLAIKNLPHQGIFYPKCVYKENKYDTRYSLYADYHYNMKLFNRYEFKYIKSTISYFNDTGSSATKIDENFLRGYKQLVIRYLGVMPYFVSRLYKFLKAIIIKFIR